MGVVDDHLRGNTRGSQQLLERDRAGRQWAPLVIYMAEAPTEDIQAVGHRGKRPRGGLVENTALLRQAVQVGRLDL